VISSSGSEVIVYGWEFNFTDVLLVRPGAQMFTNHSLYIPGVTQDDLGVYRCLTWLSGHPEDAIGSENVTVVLACEL